ncbi:hypothetical protein NEAUS03_0977 [Nematocida ausubeli]|nr:hypothetical protein NEAUS03_0977 [Nematocida ausubeli]
MKTGPAKIYGSVHSAIYLTREKEPAGGKPVELAIKIIKNRKSKEISIVKKLNHRNIIGIYSNSYCIKYRWFAMQYFKTNLKEILPIKNQEYKYYIIKCVVEGLKYLGEQNIVHRDIKPQNILIHNEEVRIGDFGVAKYTKERREEEKVSAFADSTEENGQKSDHAEIEGIEDFLMEELDSSSEFDSFQPIGEETGKLEKSGVMGTLHYIPLEILLGSRDYGCEVDMWAAGCTFWEVFFNEVCFSGDCEINQIGQIVRKIGVTQEDKDILEKYPFSGFIPITKGKKLDLFTDMSAMDRGILASLLTLDAERRSFNTESINAVLSKDYINIEYT